MTFTVQVKDEISKEQLNEIENRYLFLGYIYLNSIFKNKKMIISLENLSIARKLFKTLKYCYHIEPKITLRMQKKFKMQKVYIFEISGKNDIFINELNNINLEDEEIILSFIKGVFLASGSINDPKKSRYHLEMVIDDEEKADYIQSMVNKLNINLKKIIRNKSYMLYLKASEEISDFLKLLGAINSLFYFEDIRIYRDHKNMVNRLNNCEQANLEKSLKTSDNQLKKINYLKSHGSYSLLDEKTILVAETRLKYPEESFQVLSEIITDEIGKKVTKSYINHHFRKINDLYNLTLNKESNKKEE